MGGCVFSREREPERGPERIKGGVQSTKEGMAPKGRGLCGGRRFELRTHLQLPLRKAGKIVAWNAVSVYVYMVSNETLALFVEVVFKYQVRILL